MIRGDRILDLRDREAVVGRSGAGDEESESEVVIWPDPGRRWVLGAKEPLDGTFLDNPDLFPLAGSLDALDDALRGDFAAGDLIQLRAAYDRVASAAQEVHQRAAELLDDLDARRWR